MPHSLKQDIRKSMLSRREQLPADLRAAHSEAITAQLLLMPEYRQAETVLGYMNFGAEYASERWVDQTLAEGKRLALPKVNHHTNHLDLYWVDDPENQLAPGLWKIREPVVERCRKLALDEGIEFALLPGVAFTRSGVRLGYGGGFYDKLLASMAKRPVLVAAAFSLQVVDLLPQEANDINVDWLATEQETIDCSSEGSNS